MKKYIFWGGLFLAFILLLIYFFVPSLKSIFVSKQEVIPTGNFASNLECHDSPKYFAIQRYLSDQVGSDILIKYKKSPNQNFSCQYSVNERDFEIKNMDAEYFQFFVGDFLILDSGTGPGLRGLIVYDLNKRINVFSDRYYLTSEDSIKVVGESLTYWVDTDKKVTSQNCPSMQEYKSGGLGAMIVSRVTFDLNTLSKKTLNETMCSPVQ